MPLRILVDLRGAPERACDAYFRTGKVSLWRKHRAGLEPLWRQLHGRRKHPCDFDPPRCLETAELSARQLHERRLAEARRHQQNR